MSRAATFSRAFSALRGFLRRPPEMGEAQRFLVLSILIGIFAGLMVVCFHVAIELLAWSTVHGHAAHGTWWMLLWPAAGAGVSYALVILFFRPARGSGVNNTKAALYVSDGYLPARSVPGKFLASTISIGTGNPMGPEDPALQMGAGMASLLGRVFGLTRRSMRMIVATGAAAGIAAAFNTPITGVLFVLEEVVAAWNAAVLGSIVLSAVAAVVVTRWFLGDAPLFTVPAFELTHPSELLIYAFAGLVVGLASAVFVRRVTQARALALRLTPYRRHSLPVIAGLLVGFAGVHVPEVLGTGYAAIEGALHDGFPWYMLLLFASLKIVLTLAAFSAGTPGGMFAPTLFVGAMLGGGIGGLAYLYWPFPTSAASAYVLVGIGTFFAGVFRAPMTSVIMVFEVSQTYEIILPVMIANTISYLVSRRLQRESLFEIVAHQDGLHLPSIEEQREAPPMTVEEAFDPDRARLLSARETVRDGLKRLGDADAAVVSLGRGRWGTVTRATLKAAATGDKSDNRIETLAALESVEPLYPDVSLDLALRLLKRHPLLPVSSRANRHRFLGALALDDVLRAYGLGPRRTEPEGAERGNAGSTE